MGIGDIWGALEVGNASNLAYNGRSSASEEWLLEGTRTRRSFEGEHHPCQKAQPSLSCGEGNGTPLQYSCRETPRDGGAWWAAVYGVAQSRTQLKRPHSSSSSLSCPPLSPSAAPGHTGSSRSPTLAISLPALLHPHCQARGRQILCP